MSCRKIICCLDFALIRYLIEIGRHITRSGVMPLAMWYYQAYFGYHVGFVLRGAYLDIGQRNKPARGNGCIAIHIIHVIWCGLDERGRKRTAGTVDAHDVGAGRGVRLVGDHDECVGIGIILMVFSLRKDKNNDKCL